MSCIVCYEKTNKSTRAEANCPYCAVVICRTCIQQYVLNDISDTPRCVNPECGHGWSREWLDSVSTRQFRLETYKEHREKVLADRERSRLPESQAEAAMYKAAKQAKDEANKEMEVLKAQIYELNRQLIIHENKKYHAIRTLESFGLRPYPPSQTQVEEKPVQRQAFIRPCPADGCKGFLSTAWKCGLCEKFSCSHCLELKSSDEQHTCDPEKVASALLIQQETRPCPKCGVRITKLEGCDQMWCTACNTGFSWRTGVIATGQIHNPHYFEFLRRTGIAQQPQQQQQQANPIINCNNNRDFRIQNELYTYDKSQRGQTKRWLFEAYRLTIEYEEALREERNGEEAFRILRVRYLADEMTVDEWKAALQRTEKDTHFQQAKHSLFEMFVNSCRDILRQVTTKEHDKEVVKKQVEELIAYVNDAAKQIEKRFGRKMKQIVIKI